MFFFTCRLPHSSVCSALLLLHVTLLSVDVCSCACFAVVGNPSLGVTCTLTQPRGQERGWGKGGTKRPKVTLSAWSCYHHHASLLGWSAVMSLRQTLCKAKHFNSSPIKPDNLFPCRVVLHPSELWISPASSAFTFISWLLLCLILLFTRFRIIHK